MEFGLTEEQIMARDMIREFADREMAPVIPGYERRGEFPAPIVARLGELGILGMAIPEAYGGSAFDTVSSCLVLEEIARVCASTAITVSVHNAASSAPIARFGTPEQKQRFLPAMARGEIIGGFALTEPGCGSDAAALQTRAVRRGDTWILNGTKSWITNVHIGGVFILMAVTDPERGSRGISAFLVTPDLPGFAFGKDEDKMGLRASLTGMITLSDCEVPAAALLGEEGMGLLIALSTLDGGRIGVASQAVGIAQGAFDEARRYAQTRTAFSQNLASFQATKFKLADMATQIDAARLLTRRAAALKDSAALRNSAALKNSAGLKDRGRREFTREAAMAKLYASEMANRVVDAAVQIHGGYGYSREYLVERFYRDARVTTIYEGTSEIQRLVIARGLVGSA